MEACCATLSDDERERASRFRFARLKDSFAISRGILRTLLGHYLSIPPNQVRFTYGARGKPQLDFPEANLQFNLTHSGKLAAYAFATGCKLGIDLEAVRAMPDREPIVRRFFAREECEEWLRLGPAERAPAFFRCWTRKEAYIKALGDGLGVPLDSFRVSLRPSQPARLLWSRDDPSAPALWSLYSLAPAPSYVGCLAMADRSRSIRIFPRLAPSRMMSLLAADGRVRSTAGTHRDASSRAEAAGGNALR